MGGTRYIRFKQGDGPTFEVSVLCTHYKVHKAVQIVRDVVG